MRAINYLSTLTIGPANSAFGAHQNLSEPLRCSPSAGLSGTSDGFVMAYADRMSRDAGAM
jgi:hypothetical protein